VQYLDQIEQVLIHLDDVISDQRNYIDVLENTWDELIKHVEALEYIPSEPVQEEPEYLPADNAAETIRRIGSPKDKTAEEHARKVGQLLLDKFDQIMEPPATPPADTKERITRVCAWLQKEYNITIEPVRFLLDAPKWLPLLRKKWKHFVSIQEL
jgi:hypothetical protein